MVMLRPQSPDPNQPIAAGVLLPFGGRLAQRLCAARGVQPLFRFNMRRISPLAYGAGSDGHSDAETPDAHPPAGPTSDRWAELRLDRFPPRDIDGHLPPTDRGRRLNLLLSWGGWQNESWVDRLPALLEPMGVHSLRVRTAREAERAIRTNPVHIAVVDLGLPLDAGSTTPAPAEEAGPRVLELLRRLDSPPPTVVVQQARSARDATRHMSAALRCDAFAVVDRAAADVELMLKVLQRCMQRFYHGRWPGSP
jgi:hypothetical protein